MNIREILLEAGINIANWMIDNAQDDLNRQIREQQALLYGSSPLILYSKLDPDKIVEGSIAEPITDEGRLLG